MELEQEAAPVESPEVVEPVQIDSEPEQAQTDVQAETEVESGELEISIEGESPPPEQQDSSVIREMRKALREGEKERKRLREELESVKSPKVEVGEKPTLEQFDYDADAFESALLKWSDNKRKADAELAKKQEAEAEVQRAYAERVERYNAEKRTLRIAGYEEAEAAVTETLNVTQQSVLIRYFDKPALLVAAIGSNPETAKRLSAISDPIEFAFAVRDLESKVKATPRKPPAPEPAIASARGVTLASREKQLMDAAVKSGDFSEYHRYRQSLRTK